jgi:hypothetical protein
VNDASILAHLQGGGCVHIVPCKYAPGPEADMLVYFKDEDGKEKGFIKIPLERFHVDVWDHGAFKIEVELYTEGGDLSVYAGPPEVNA